MQYDSIQGQGHDPKVAKMSYFRVCLLCHYACNYKKAVLPQGNRAMPQVFFSVEVRQQHSLQV